MTTPHDTPLRGLLQTEPAVVTAGAELFAQELRDQAVPVREVEWRPPMDGTAEALATVLADPRLAEANARALERITSAEAELVRVAPASEALGLQRGEFLHSGPPLTWERASGPMRGALIGAMLFEGLASTPEEDQR